MFSRQKSLDQTAAIRDCSFSTYCVVWASTEPHNLGVLIGNIELEDCCEGQMN